jgi:integrase/recombinase XerD
MKTIIAERIIHKGNSCIALRFPFDRELIAVVRGFQDARWSDQQKYWYIADREDVITLLLKAFKGKAFIDYSAIKVSQVEKLDVKHNPDQDTSIKKAKGIQVSALPALSERGKEDIREFSRWMESNRFSVSTIRTYQAMMIKFLRFNRPKEASECTSADLIRIV